MIIQPTDIIKCYGNYRMKLTPKMKLDHNNEPIMDQSVGIISVHDVSKRLSLLWSKTLSITEAHAALTLFEGIGYYTIQDNF